MSTTRTLSSAHDSVHAWLGVYPRLEQVLRWYGVILDERVLHLSLAELCTDERIDVADVLVDLDSPGDYDARDADLGDID